MSIERKLFKRRIVWRSYCLSVMVLLAIACCSPCFAQGGGAILYEVGTADMGLSGAGAGARAQDSGTAYFNPAGMTRLDRHEILLGAFFVYQNTRYESKNLIDLGGGEYQMADPWGGVANYGVYSVNERLKLGMSVNVFLGGGSDYDALWVGRSMLTQEELKTFNFEPSIAYKLTDKLSIGAGINIYYAVTDTEFGIGPIKMRVENADDIDWGFSLGALYEFNDNTRVGLTYRSNANISMDGDADSNAILSLSFQRDYQVPRAANLSMFHQMNDKWAILGDVGWTDWSDFSDTLTILGPLNVQLDRKWKDTWRIGLGAQYQRTEKLMLTAGLSYDSSPLDDSDRYPDIPQDQHFRASIGAQYTLNDNIDLGLTYTYLDLGNAELDGVRIPPLYIPTLWGEYDNTAAHFIGSTLRYRF